jgi:uncharacterized repeat protein (TIGR01451 family)
MKTHSRNRVFPIALLILLALSAIGVLAQKVIRPDVRVSLTGTVARGGNSIPVEKAGQVNPGEVVNWTIISQNDGTGPARDYKAIGNIPKGTEIIGGTATGEGSPEVVYSIDGGKTFYAIPQIEVKQPDGSVKQMAAPLSMYTQIRYEWKDPLAAGGRLSASYKVRVR